jgi:hypothetical protein
MVFAGLEAAVELAELALEEVDRLSAVAVDADGRAQLVGRSCADLARLAGGLAFSNASLGVNHALAHSVGARFGIAHGRVNGVFLPHVPRYNAAIPAKFVAARPETPRTWRRRNLPRPRGCSAGRPRPGRGAGAVPRARGRGWCERRSTARTRSSATCTACCGRRS